MNTAQDRKKTDHNGYWYIEDNPISRAGVFQYLGSQISEELEPDRLYNVYRPAEELFNPEAMKSFELIPFVNDHEMLGKGQTPAEEYGVHGVLGEKIGRKGDMLTADIKIYSEALKDEINNGKKELSLGYYCDYDLTPGTYKGQHYDAVQRNLRGNHIALVDKGRMGHDVRVMDGMAFDNISVPDGWITIGAKDPDEESGKNGHKGKHIYINAATGAIEKGGPKEWQGKTQKEVFGKGKETGNTSGGAKPASSPAPTSKTASPTPDPAAKSPSTATTAAEPTVPKRNEQGKYKLSDFKIKKETAKAYLLADTGTHDVWIPKSAIREGLIAEWKSKDIEEVLKEIERKKSGQITEYPQKTENGNYKFSDFEVKRETEKAYMISKGGYSGWIPKKGVKKDGEISSKFTQEIEIGILEAKNQDYAERELGDFNLWTNKPYQIEPFSYRITGRIPRNGLYGTQRIYFPDGSYAERKLKYIIESEEDYIETSSYKGLGWTAENGEAKEKLEKVKKIFPDNEETTFKATDTADFSGETEAQAAAKENSMDRRKIVREIMAIAAKDPAEFEGGEEEKIKAVAELAETLAYGDGKEDKPEGDDITTAPPEEEEKKTETETETETEIKTENENKEEDAAKCDAEPQAVQGTRLEIKALPPEKDDVVKKAADMAAEKVSKNIYEMQELKARITPHIGEFDSSKMRSVADMADYALRKMGKKAKGDKVAYLEGCLSEMKQERQLYGMASDGMAADEMEADTLDEILKGVK